MNLFFEIHKDLPREGPGSDADTNRAYDLVASLLPRNPRILDVACGPGKQTLQLARRTRQPVTAVDLHFPFLLDSRSSAEQASLGRQVSLACASMTDLPFPAASFDLIWSEGAIYIMGFENGLKAWRRLLRPGGCVAVTEISYFVSDPAEELRRFWSAAYPGMTGIQEKIRQVERSGYRLLGQFRLPESSWWNGYYNPLHARIEQMRERYAGNSEMLQQTQDEEDEMELYRKYAKQYGYVFYLMQVV